MNKKRTVAALRAAGMTNDEIDELSGALLYRALDIQRAMNTCKANNATRGFYYYKNRLRDLKGAAGKLGL